MIRIKRWFGGSDAKTSERCFYFNDDHQYGMVEKQEQIKNVINLLYKLRDKRFVELIYVDTTKDDRMVAAFRFTSDRSYDRFRDQLVRMGSSLGRGAWSPFSDNHQFQEWFAEEVPA